MTETTSQMVDRGGLIELDVGDDVRSSSRFNEDIAPTQASERTWSKWNIAALWVACRSACHLHPRRGINRLLRAERGGGVVCHFVGQRDRADSSYLKRLSRYEVWYSFSGGFTLFVRYFRFQRTLSGARPGRLRLVWYSNHVWRFGHSSVALRVDSRLGCDGRCW